MSSVLPVETGSPVFSTSFPLTIPQIDSLLLYNAPVEPSFAKHSQWAEKTVKELLRREREFQCFEKSLKEHLKNAEIAFKTSRDTDFSSYIEKLENNGVTPDTKDPLSFFQRADIHDLAVKTENFLIQQRRTEEIAEDDLH